MQTYFCLLQLTKSITSFAINANEKFKKIYANQQSLKEVVDEEKKEQAEIREVLAQVSENYKASHHHLFGQSNHSDALNASVISEFQKLNESLTLFQNFEVEDFDLGTNASSRPERSIEAPYEPYVSD